MLAIGGTLLQGCAEKVAPSAPAVPVFAADMHGAAKVCTVPRPQLRAGKDTIAAMRLGNDGGWCAISVADGGKPYATGLLTEAPAHGSVYIHPVGNDTRIDYTPDQGFGGGDRFAVTLLPGSAVLRVDVTVTR